jgi:small subunit ribosomal protein S7
MADIATVPVTGKDDAAPKGPSAPAAEEAPALKKQVRKRVPKPAMQNNEQTRTAERGEILLFKKYDYNVEVLDPSLKNYINLRPMTYPTSFRRTSKKKFSKAGINIVERLANDMMRGGTGGKIGGRIIRTKGRLQGKKIKIMAIIEKAFDIVHKQTGKNPIQVLVNALEYASPIEDTTRVRYGGIISNVPVDISASRRLDVALRNMAMATVIASFASKKDIVNALASELILASKNDVNSYAIKRKNEIERMARSAK